AIFRLTTFYRYKASSRWTYGCLSAEKDMTALLLLELIVTPSLACFGGPSGGSGGLRCCPCCQQPSVPNCGGGASLPAMCSPMGTGEMGGVGIMEGFGGLGTLGGLGGLGG
ncbi:hypothetical protein V3C99_006997, partial [Haemonchus contortus]